MAITAMTKDDVKEAIERMLGRLYNLDSQDAQKEQLYKAAALTVNEILVLKRHEFFQKTTQRGDKRVYYISLEFLMGRSLKNNLYNLGLTEAFDEALKEMGSSLEEAISLEPDAGLGNGGLGRLAACYMDALASLGYSAMGFSLRYEYGLFRQKLVEGCQVELPDVWLPGGDVWLSRREDNVFPVYFGGEVEEVWEEGHLKINYKNCQKVLAEAYDMMVSGADSQAVAVLRLWRACSAEQFDLRSFSLGDYQQVLAKDKEAEIITKVLYPPDSTQSGKELRMKQQYLLISASVQQIFRHHLEKHCSLDNLPEKAAVHINDTHPVFCIPEMMRLLLDEHGYAWEKAFEIVQKTVSYTNHTVLLEALEVWPENLVKTLLPRIYQIIVELNKRFCLNLSERFGGDWGKIEKMSLISGGQIKMANLAVYGSHTVNGVSRLHSDILKETIFKDFYSYCPEKFTNVTNGIAHRRWLCQSNPKLTALLNELIGTGYQKNAEELRLLRKFSGDNAVLSKLQEIKLANKHTFASDYFKQSGRLLNPESIFDVQVKRLHEYKRQLLNALRLLSVYLDLQENPDLDILPRTYIFGAKAASSYVMAKEIIRFIYHLGAEISHNPRVNEKLSVVFVENYCVSMAERLMPAAEVSEQISLAGKEASGTGNMKLMINGALTIGTLDGANVEIAEAVGAKNIFLFGMQKDEVQKLWQRGYSSSHLYQYNPNIKRVIDRLFYPINGEDFSGIARYLVIGERGIADPYMCLADFQDYCRVQKNIDECYRNNHLWNELSLVNIAEAGRFAADRAIDEYAKKIWRIETVE